MRKIYLLLTAAISLTFLSGAAYGQTAEEIMDRYIEVSGLKGCEDMRGRSIYMDMNVLTMGLDMNIKGTILYPSRMRFDMTVAGQNMLLVIDGEKGWMVAAGMKQVLPPEQVKQMSAQNDMFSQMTFDKDRFELTLLDPVTEKGKKYDVLKAVEKAKTGPEAESIIYLDSETGFVVRSTGCVPGADGSLIATKVIFGDIRDFNGIKMPETMLVTAGNISTEIKVKSFEMDYPTEEWMFAEPE